jgi:hypothetical protein
MIETTASAPESLRLDRIREILCSAGPCVTLLLPPNHPGEASNSEALWKSVSRNLIQELVARRLPEDVAGELIEPLQDLVDLPAGSHWGRVVFRSPDVLRQFWLPGNAKTALAVGGCFEVRPILNELHLPEAFYVLTLTKKRIGLLRCTGTTAERIALPSGVPETLDEALRLEPPDHDLENRSAIGGAAGVTNRIRFGTGHGRETQHTYLSDFYKVVDRGLTPFLNQRNTQLVLAGVGEDTSVYRFVNTYAHLANGSIQGGKLEDALAEQLGRQAYAILQTQALEREAGILAELEKHASPDRFTSDFDSILRLAFEGRLHQLFVQEGAARMGVFARPEYRSWGSEDLVNLAAVQAVRHGGLAFTLPRAAMPEGPAAAILRF